MEWLDCIRKSIDFMESHLLDDIGAEDVARRVHVSPFLLQRGFSVVTGFGIAEYIRNRRLHLAAVDLADGREKVIDTAFRYGWETPESFAKAFSRFHGATPSQVRNGQAAAKSFLPLNIHIEIHGGNQMKCKIAPMFPFKIIGFPRVFGIDGAYKEIPEFWDEICAKYAANVYAGNPPANPREKALVDNCIGEYGVCIDDAGDGKYRYLIAGKYTGGDVPEGMALYEFPAGEWAVFDCVGPVPEVMPEVNTRIFKEWLPGNPDWELSGNATIEWYDCIHGEKTDPDYHSAIWIPVKRKGRTQE